MAAHRFGRLFAFALATGTVVGLTGASVVLNARTEGAAVSITRGFAAIAYVGAGMGAAIARPRSRVGELMALAGVAWALIDINLTATDDPTHGVLFTVVTMLKPWFVVILAHILLTYPEGRARSAVDRRLVAGLYVMAGVLQLGYMLTADTIHIDCPACPPNVLLLLPNQVVARSIVLVGDALTVIAAVVVLLRIVGHWRATSAVGRRALAPVLWAIGPIVTAAVIIQVAAVTTPPPHSEPIFVLGPLAYIALPAALTFGLLRTRLDRGGVSRLVVELGDGAPPVGMRDTLARVLHDPTVELLYWSDEEQGYVDRAGTAVPSPPVGGARAMTVLERAGAPIGAILHDPRLEDDPELVRAVASAAGMSVHNERLAADLKVQLAEVQASRERIVAAGDEERRRLERDLHDGAQQRLLTLSMLLKTAMRQAEAGDLPPVAAELAAADAQLHEALVELRELAHGIRPPLLTQGGLGPAVEQLAGRAPIGVKVTGVPDQRFPQGVEAAAYFVVSEALANVVKHAHASAASVDCAATDGRLVIKVADDGVGGADPSRGSGLRGLADRVAAMRGTLIVDSRPGGGTSLTVELPCE